MAKKRRRFRKRSREEWERLLAEYMSSGLSRREFAQARGLSVSSLSRWVQRLRREQEEGRNRQPQAGLIELVAEPPPVSAAVGENGTVLLRVGEGVCLELPEWPVPDYVAQIARAYEAVSPC